jgi:RhtB (resistance to homoserine/threonine) family protein
MSYLPLLLSVAAVHWLAMMSPGPNILVVSQTAVQRSRAHGLAAALGIASGALVWSSLVALGLVALLALVPWIHGAIRIIGGGYLIYLGVRLWMGADRPLTAGTHAVEGTLRSAYARGLVTNLTNPQSAAYFSGVFALFIHPDTPAWVLAAAVAIVAGSASLWYGALALLFSTGPAQSVYGRISKWIDRTAGAVMAGFGVHLLIARN